MLPTHRSSGYDSVAPQPTTSASALAQAPGSGPDPLTLSGTFGWLPANAANAGYSLHDNELQAVARGVPSGPAQLSPMIWLTVYPEGVTPSLGLAADGKPEFRIAAPDVNGQPAYWMTESRTDPTNADDTYLRWQSPDGQWGELHGYYLATSAITAELLRVAAGVDFAPHSVPLPLWISGLPRTTVAVEADLDRPAMSGPGPWDLELILMIGGDTVQISVEPAAAPKNAVPPLAGQSCATAHGLTACVLPNATAGLPSTLSSAAAILRHVNLLGTDSASWTTDVIRN